MILPLLICLRLLLETFLYNKGRMIKNNIISLNKSHLTSKILKGGKARLPSRSSHFPFLPVLFSLPSRLIFPSFPSYFSFLPVLFSLPSLLIFPPAHLIFPSFPAHLPSHSALGYFHIRTF